MIFRLFVLIALVSLTIGAPVAAYADYGFEGGGAVNQYTDTVDGDDIATMTGSAARTVDWLGLWFGGGGRVADCEALAASSGQAEGTQLWCVQKDTASQTGNNCVYTCQNTGDASATYYNSVGSVTSFLYTSRPTIETHALGQRGSGHDCGSSTDPAHTICVFWATTVPAACTLPGSEPSSITLHEVRNAWFVGGTSSAEMSDIDSSCLASCYGAGYTYCNVQEVYHAGAEPYTNYSCYGVTNPTGVESRPAQESPERYGNTVPLTTRTWSANAGSCTIPFNQPNLAAGAVTPTAVAVGSPVSLSSVITNSGATATGAGFTNLFQIDDADHTVVSTALTDTSPAVAAGGTDTSSVTHTFASAGTWYVRACADNNTSFAGTIAESSETDNCGPWTSITVGGGPALSCSASPSSPTIGQTVTYSVTPTGLTPYTWTPSETGTALGSSGTSVTRSYAANGNYAMTVSKSGYSSATCNVSVGAAPVCTGGNVTVTASPERVTSGQSSTLTISGSGINTTCTVRNVNTNAVIQTITATACNIPTTIVGTGSLTTQTSFSVTCDTGGGGGGGDTTVTGGVTVNVIPRIIEF